MFLVDNIQHQLINVDNFDGLKISFKRYNMDDPEELTFTLELMKSSTHSSLILKQSDNYEMIKKDYDLIKQSWMNGEKELELSLDVWHNPGFISTRE